MKKSRTSKIKSGKAAVLSKNAKPSKEAQVALSNALPAIITHEQLLQALYWAFDIFERAAMPFIVINQTAEAVITTSQLEGDAIHVGVRINEWESGARRIQDPYKVIEDDLIEFKPGDVPILVRILPDDVCIRVPDTKVYYHEVFNVPNPYSRFKEIYG